MATLNPSLCSALAGIIGGTASTQNGVCVVTKIRHLNVSILGRHTNSPLALAELFSFEPTPGTSTTLNLGELPLLEREVKPFLKCLADEGILVTALHNHWLFDSPRLMFIHFEAVSNPVIFALKVAKCLRLIGA